ncbi:MAG: hypothetical protein H6581_01785 [Bacteroidia bacterium]|nr:hypothetical protein [Bacteroidia bacterium]
MKPTIAIYGIRDQAQTDSPGYTHDHSICVMENGKITHYLQLERHSRRKYDNQMHLHLESLIEDGLLPFPCEADLIFVNSFVGNSFISQTGKIRFEQVSRTQLTPDLIPGFARVETEKWDGKEYPAFSMDHELAHVFSNLPFHGPFRENSLHLHFDGGASLGNFSAFLFKKGKMEVLECHWELSHLSKFFNDNALTFALLNHGPAEHCAVPGKLMGFATLGKPEKELRDWLIQHNWFKEIWLDKSSFYRAAKRDFKWEGSLGDTHDPFLQNLAACFQREFEIQWINYLCNLQQKVKADFLYLSGGCALNIVANTQIVNLGLFQDVFIPPCPGDSGLSIGAAAFLEWKKHGKVEFHSPYLNNAGLAESTYTSNPELIRQIAENIAQSRIIGVANGAGEAGPRALGNRSILARPDSKELAQKVSVECKGREWYRPVAPIMLEKHARRLTGLASIHHLSKYMLLDFHIPQAQQKEIAGVVHANGTARIQTLFQRTENPFIWDLLTYLDEVHGIPALINTSLNQRGEPIVHTPDQAFKSAVDMGLDGVVIDYELQMLQPHEKYELERD